MKDPLDINTPEWGAIGGPAGVGLFGAWHCLLHPDCYLRNLGRSAHSDLWVFVQVNRGWSATAGDLQQLTAAVAALK